mgnify:CR=1 FL=1
MFHTDHPIVKSRTLVPLDIIADVLSAKKRITMLRVYLYINAYSHGTRTLDKAARKDVAKALRISERHVRTCIKWLERDFGWFGKLGGDPDHFIVRGFRKILERRGEDASFQSSVLFTDSGIIENKERFEAWLFASHIGGIARRKTHIYFRRLKIKEPRDNGEEPLYGSNKRGSTPSQHSRSTFFWPVAAEYIKKSLGCSISTAAGYRAAAERFGFIKVKRYRRALTQADLEKAAIDDPDLLKRLIRQRGRILVDGIHGIRAGADLFFKEMSTRKRKRLSKSRFRNLTTPRMGYMAFLDDPVSIPLLSDNSMPF